MASSCVQINDLPDEILMLILKKLYNTEVLYSLIGVNKRLNTIAQDSNFTNDLTLFERLSDRSICLLPDSILDRFCFEILPEISHKIKWLNVEQTFMKRIVLPTNYSNLCGLSLYKIDVEDAISLFTNDTVFTHIKNQIVSFVIDITGNRKQILSTDDIIRIVFTHIFIMFSNLQYLKFAPSPFWHQQLSFDLSPPTVMSSTLLELHVYLTNFRDCLYLLDGRFNQLHTFHVNIYRISDKPLAINSKEKLPNLRCFSLYSDLRVHVYDELVVPLLHRMVNLEKLDLHLRIDRYKGLIDGNELKENIINHMTRLNKFTCYIRSFNRSPNQTNLPPSEDIQHMFKNFTNSQITSWVDYFPERRSSQCDIYSYPHRMEYYNNITNKFPGGLFKYVSRISLYDERPFEREFFIQIEKSFPFMRELKIENDKPQKNKSYRKSNDNQHLSIIKYIHLRELDLGLAHDDYVEQFLIDTEMCLPNNVHLYVEYQSLKEVTQNFKRDATQINCAKVTYLVFDNPSPYPKHFKDYFPLADIN